MSSTGWVAAAANRAAAATTSAEGSWPARAASASVAAIGGRVGVGDAAAHGAPVADGDMADLRHRRRQDGHRPADQRILLELALTGHRPDRQMPIVTADVSHFADPVEIDEHPGLGEAD